MRCPNCGSERPKNTKFCGKCGFRLDGTLCPNCGSFLPSGARRCEVCGTPLDPKTKPPARKRKGWKIALAVVLCLALAVGGVVGAWKLIWSEDAQLVKAAENYAEVNETLLAVTTVDGYDDLTTAEKAEQVLGALDDLADEGKVLADSVGYDESYPLVYYSYADGAYGGVMLEEFAEDTSGVGESTYDTSLVYDEGTGWDFEPWPAVPTFGTDDSPYESDPSALVVCDMGDGYEKYLELAQSMQSSWNEAYLDTTLVEKGTVAFYRTGLSGYDLAVIQEHGIIYRGNPAVALQETSDVFHWVDYNVTGNTFTAEERLILRDIQSNRIVLSLLGDCKFHFLLLPEFFSCYYADDGLEDTIVWIGCCDGYHNDALVSAFADCGAKAVLAPTETINTHYDYLTLDAFVYMLMCGNTVEESLAFAQSQWGANDREFKETFLGIGDSNPSEVRIYCGDDETLVALTEEGQNTLKGITCSGTVIDAKDSSVPIAGAMVTVTDADGAGEETTTDETGAFEIALCPGTYTVQIEMDGYDAVEFTVSVDAQEDVDAGEIVMTPTVVDRLEYEMREEEISACRGDGSVYYEHTVTYPYFLGNSAVASLLNQRYSEKISAYKNSMPADGEDAYQEWADDMGGVMDEDMLPFYENLTAEVCYNRNGAISIKETYEYWTGGAHIYRSEEGVNWDLHTGELLTYLDILAGTDQQRDNAIKYYLDDAGIESSTNYEHELSTVKEYTAYTLCEDGLCFYYNYGDAVPRVEVTIPFTDDTTWEISLDVLDLDVFRTELYPLLSSYDAFNQAFSGQLTYYATEEPDAEFKEAMEESGMGGEIALYTTYCYSGPGVDVKFSNSGQGSCTALTLTNSQYTICGAYVGQTRQEFLKMGSYSVDTVGDVSFEPSGDTYVCWADIYYIEVFFDSTGVICEIQLYNYL